LGKRYEAAVSKQLGPMAQQGIWWEYKDSNGPGLCQTDFIIEGEIWCIILECKHSWTAEGMEQLNELYLPVLEMALNKKTAGIQVCKHLSSQCFGRIYDNLETAVAAAKSIRPVTLHWRAIGPITRTSLPTKELNYEHIQHA
jgi:hypothetical protein